MTLAEAMWVFVKLGSQALNSEALAAIEGYGFRPIYMYVYTHVYVNVCMYIYISYKCIYIYVCVLVYVYIYIYISVMYVCMYVSI